MIKEFLSLREAAEYLDMSKSSIYKLTSSRSINFTKPNRGKIYFNKEDLDQWVEKNKFLSKENVRNQSIKQLKENKNGRF